MTQRKNFFQSAFDAIVEARTREAKRRISYYTSHLNSDHGKRTGE